MHVKKDYCDVPRASRKRRGTIWYCDCGQAWLLKRTRYETETGRKYWYRWNRIDLPLKFD